MYVYTYIICMYVQVIIVLALLFVLPGEDINSKYRICIFLAGIFLIL